MKIDLERLADYRRGACLPACGCPARDLAVVRIERQEWQRARTRYRLQCSACARWAAKFVPERFIDEG